MSAVRQVVIIGSGPAGLTAAIYAARANLSPLVLAGAKWGGQLMLTTNVENYPGFPGGVLGPDLMQKMLTQAREVGAEIINMDVEEVDFGTRPFVVKAGDKTYQAKSVIIATGAESLWLGLPSEQRLIGRGVSSCAPCDAPFFKDKVVVVVGGGDSAMEEALYLTKFAKEVTIIHRRDSFRASKIMQDRVLGNSKIKTIFDSGVVEILGQDKVTGVKLKNLKSNLAQEMSCDAVFVAIGHAPNTKIFTGQVELDEKGYIKKITNDKLQMTNGSYSMMTSVEGVFVSGDVHDFHYKQAITAAAYGCQAAMEAEKWLSNNDKG